MDDEDFYNQMIDAIYTHSNFNPIEVMSHLCGIVAAITKEIGETVNHDAENIVDNLSEVVKQSFIIRQESNTKH